MHPEVIGGLGLAIACALGTNLGGLWKYKGAVACEAVDIRRPWQTAVMLFRSKWWMIGWLVAAAGWLLHVGALALAPISLAQAVISGGLVLLGVIAERWFGFELHARQWVGLGLVALGMAVLAGTARSASSHSSFGAPSLAVFEFVVAALGVAFAFSCRIARLCKYQGLMLGAAAGLLFGISDVSIKAVTGGNGGVILGLIWALTALLAGIAAFYASARSLQVGDGLAVIASTAAAANVIGIVGGVLVFGDPLGSGGLMITVRVVAFLMVVVAVGLIPAPVRAQEKLAEEAREEQEDETVESTGPRASAEPVPAASA